MDSFFGFQQQTKAGDDVEGSSAVPELSREVTGSTECHREPAGHSSAPGLSDSSGSSCTHRLGISDQGREAGWGRDVVEDSDSGWHTWGAGSSTDMSHPSCQAGRASFPSRRLIWGWLISKRKSDGGMQEAVFLQERYLSSCEMRGKINQKEPISMKRELFWRGKGNEEDAQPSETA